jgi:hypothetical protein
MSDNAPDTLQEAGVSYFRDKQGGEHPGWTRHEYWMCLRGKRYANHVYTMTRRGFLTLLLHWSGRGDPAQNLVATPADYSYEEKTD